MRLASTKRELWYCTKHHSQHFYICTYLILSTALEDRYEFYPHLQVRKQTLVMNLALDPQRWPNFSVHAITHRAILPFPQDWMNHKHQTQGVYNCDQKQVCWLCKDLVKWSPEGRWGKCLPLQLSTGNWCQILKVALLPCLCIVCNQRCQGLKRALLGKFVTQLLKRAHGISWKKKKLSLSSPPLPFLGHWGTKGLRKYLLG